MNYLELDDVLAIACEVLGLEVNALLHVTDVGLADSAVARPKAGFAGQEFHPTLEAKAAFLLLGLARNHAFIDGNKRIAVLATLQFLNVNDYDLDLLPVEEVYKTVVEVASGNLSLDDLTDWIRDRMKPLSGP
ncbi:MAG: type II toxin-antitoxin system death-on-curing family toxin [Acidimicrobiaceae bacterium]|nr:type II toxin-antitoxin system death-on-curing family toxin [Acidimicrobiaceae bacterium]MYH00453.1 type II toxin-antitoxin system death-on-curing family toxin [Acidimicrobiaceae bacterium]